MSYLDRLQAAQKAPVTEPLKGAKGGSDPFEGSDTGQFRALPPHLVQGLAALQSRAPPQITRPEIWLAVVADAVRLAADGWAAQALRLGWSPLELWGCSPERGGNPDHDGLAVWIDGRRVLLVDGASCWRRRRVLIRYSTGDQSRRVACCYGTWGKEHDA